MKKLNKQKGITLIALVITITVMLILVAVTINMAINGGLFEKAGQATGNTRNAMNAEQALSSGQITIDGITYASIDDYLEGNLLAVHNWTRTGDKFTCSHCNATYEMGQVVNYKAKGKISTTISAAKSGLDKYYAEFSEYPTGADIAQNIDLNGTQEIEVKSTQWVVLGIEDTDGNGTNETLLITTKRGVAGVYFYGASAYNNATSYIGTNGRKVEGEIDRICRELYSNSEYGEARGMTIEDVNSALNYEPIGGEYGEEYVEQHDDGSYYGETIKTTGNLTTKLKDLPIWDAIKDEHQTPNGINTEATLGEYELNDYTYQLSDDGTALKNKVNDATSAITEVERNTIIYSDVYYVYLLASRCVKASSYGNVVGFKLWCVSPNFVSGEPFYYNDGQSRGRNSKLRPVVSLKSKLPTAVKK